MRINGSVDWAESVSDLGVTVRFRSCARCRMSGEASDNEVITMLAATNIEVV
jgi:hypothetical protein